MYNSQSKISRHAEKWKNITNYERESQSIKIKQESTQIIEFVGKDIKTVSITVFCIFKKLEERLDIINGERKDANETHRDENHTMMKKYTGTHM